MFAQKIDRNCFLCYKKSFLSYSIFNLRYTSDSSLLQPFQRVSLTIITQALWGCQAISTTFSEKFLFFKAILFACFPFGQLVHSITPQKRCQLFFCGFFVFFAKIFCFSGKEILTTICCIFRSIMVQLRKSYTWKF